MNALLRITLLLTVAFATGCGSLLNIRLFVVGRQTALERQVLGTYEDLGQDVLSYSSVRGVSPEGELIVPPPATPSQAAAMAAMRNREYNADDVDALRRDGVVGEGNNAMLIIRKDPIPVVGPLSAELVRRIISEENSDRQTVLSRLLATTPGVTTENHSEVARIFAGIQQDAAPTGTWVQNQAGAWSVK